MSKSTVSALRGWLLVGLTAVVVSAMVAALMLTSVSEIEGLRSAIRATARSSVALFLLAFTASATWRFWPNAFTRWQRQNRRYLGVSFAVSHFIHLGAILALRERAPAELADIPTMTWVLGGFAYALIAAMTLTSFDRTAQMIGPRAWKTLHTVGVYYVWIVFANSYIGRALMIPEYIPIALLVLAALGLRIAARIARARAPQAALAN